MCHLFVFAYVGLRGTYFRPAGMAKFCNRTDNNLHFHHFYLSDFLQVCAFTTAPTLTG